MIFFVISQHETPNINVQGQTYNLTSFFYISYTKVGLVHLDLYMNMFDVSSSIWFYIFV